MKLKITYAIISWLVLIAFLSISAQAQHGVVKGKVKEQGGKALEGVIVRTRAANASNEKDRHETKTDSKGDFELTGLATADYILTFEHPGFRTFTSRRLEVKDGEIIKLRQAVELSREREGFAVIRGAVFTSEGISLPNASVIIERLGENHGFKKRETTSGEGGEFAFRLPNDKATYRVTAKARGFQPLSKEVSVDSDEVRQIALALERIK